MRTFEKITEDRLISAVRNTASILDKTLPDWPTRIRDTIVMSDAGLCVGGQLNVWGRWDRLFPDTPKHRARQLLDDGYDSSVIDFLSDPNNDPHLALLRLSLWYSEEDMVEIATETWKEEIDKRLTAMEV